MEASQSLSDILSLSARTSTFLSVDVVGSTTLKDGEPEQDILYTFLAYHKLVTDQAYANHGEVIHITGDGLMCRFQKAADAMAAAQSILTMLAEFNTKHNRLRGTFALRLGLHTGQVLENEQLEGGRLISKTIDIAAKLQQAAGADRAYASEATVAEIPQGETHFRRIGWEAHLQLNIYELIGHSVGQDTRRKLPDKANLLLVDQELEGQAIVRKALFGKPFEVFAAYGQGQASLLMKAWEPSLVVLSVDLPWDGGWDLLRQARGNALLSATPIICSSQHTSGDVVQRCFRLGANGFLRKPFDPPQVVKRLELVMREFYR